MPPHGSGLRGARKRLAPAVDAPYGIPRNTWTPSLTTPRTFPDVVSTTGLLVALGVRDWPVTAAGTVNSALPASEDFSNVRRLILSGIGQLHEGACQRSDIDTRGNH
jgi:hypothetical protein